VRERPRPRHRHTAPSDVLRQRGPLGFQGFVLSEGRPVQLTWTADAGKHASTRQAADRLGRRPSQLGPSSGPQWPTVARRSTHSRDLDDLAGLAGGDGVAVTVALWLSVVPVGRSSAVVQVAGAAVSRRASVSHPAASRGSVMPRPRSWCRTTSALKEASSASLAYSASRSGAASRISIVTWAR
jgi:hypothetical protein